MQSAVARAVVAARDHILRFMHWLKVQNVLNAKLFPPHTSSPVFFSMSLQYSLLGPLDHLHWSLSPTTSSPVSRSLTVLFGMLHLMHLYVEWASFYPSCSLSFWCIIVTSSSPSSVSNAGPVIDSSHRVFYCSLNTLLFLKIFSWYLSTRYLAVTDGDSVKLAI